MKIRYSEKGIWDLYHFVLFNLKAISDVTDSFDYIVDGEKNLVFMVDFSDIHPVMYPERNQNYYDREMTLHGKGVRLLWENFFNLENPLQNFKLALTPGAKLEVLESLRHCKCRVEDIFSKYVPREILKKSSKDIFEYVSKKDINKHDMLYELNKIANNDFLEEAAKKPAQKIVELFDKKLIDSLENLIPEKIISDLIYEFNPNDKMAKSIVNHFSSRPRRETKIEYQIQHDNFHDAIDIYNLLLTYDINLLCNNKYKNYFLPFVTHTERVIAAGRKLGKINHHAIVHRSIAPVYIATGLCLMDKYKLKNHFQMALFTINSLYDELKNLTVINKLKSMSRRIRDKYLEESEVFIEVTDRTIELFSRFCRDLYAHIDENFTTCNIEYTNKLVDNNTIEDIGEVIRRIKSSQKKSKDEAINVKKKINFSFDDGISTLYTPGDEFTKDIADWLEEDDEY